MSDRKRFAPALILAFGCLLLLSVRSLRSLALQAPLSEKAKELMEREVRAILEAQRARARKILDEKTTLILPGDSELMRLLTRGQGSGAAPRPSSTQSSG